VREDMYPSIPVALSGGSLINLHSKYDIEQKGYREFNG
jgi:hypothetical protein